MKRGFKRKRLLTDKQRANARNWFKRIGKGIGKGVGQEVGNIAITQPTVQRELEKASKKTVKEVIKDNKALIIGFFGIIALLIVTIIYNTIKKK